MTERSQREIGSRSVREVNKLKSTVRSLLACPPQRLSDLDDFRLLLSRVYAVELPVVSGLSSLKNVKEFCSGLLNRCERHPWKAALKRAGLRTRVGVSASMFLFRKVLPSHQPADAERSYVNKMSSPQAPPDPGFLSFVEEELGRMFHFGWDFDGGYDELCENLTLPTSSCLEGGRKDGGARGWSMSGGLGRFGYLDAIRGSSVSVPDVVDVGRAVCAGKTRLVTKSSALSAVLRPLHSVLYNHLTKNKCFVRGKAEPATFEGFTKREGEVFVSGDYESATDNLNQAVSLKIMEVILSRTTRVSDGVKREAMRAFKPWLQCRGLLAPLRRGQLMGQLLSFPVLCLTNYLAFRYLVPRKVPVRVNGDDIVFRATPEEARVWACGVTRAGLVLSPGKTLTKNSWFSLNSTFFQATDTAVLLLPVVRSSSLYPRVECASAVAGRLASCCEGFRGEERVMVQTAALKGMRSAIYASQRSLTRGLDCTVSKAAMRASGLWSREVFYLSFPDENPLPAPKKLWVQNAIPEGWSRSRVSGPTDESRFFKEMCDLTWVREPLKGATDAYWSRLREDAPAYAGYLPLLKRRIALSVSMGLYTSVSSARRALSEHIGLRFPSLCAKGKLVWVKKDVGCLRHLRVAFA